MAPKKATSGRNAELAKERNAQRKAEQEQAKADAKAARDAAKAARDQQEADEEGQEEELGEGDVVEIAGDGVPESLKTSPMSAELLGLQDGGFNGKVGRITGQETGPAGVMYVVEGGDFSRRVPALALKRAKAEQPKAAKKSSAKKAAKKAAKKSSKR